MDRQPEGSTKRSVSLSKASLQHGVTSRSVQSQAISRDGKRVFTAK